MCFEIRSNVARRNDIMFRAEGGKAFSRATFPCTTKRYNRPCFTYVKKEVIRSRDSDNAWMESIDRNEELFVCFNHFF